MNHLQRWLTSLALLPLVFVAVWFPASPGRPWPLALAAMIVGVAAMVEYLRLTGLGDAWWRWVIALNAALFLPALASMLDRVFIAVLIALLLLGALGAVLTYRPGGDWFDRLARLATGIFWVVMPLTLLVILRGLESGRGWIFFTLVVVIATDVGGYYVGRLGGRHPLHPELSPKKTWEGALGGLALAMAVGVGFSFVPGPGPAGSGPALPAAVARTVEVVPAARTMLPLTALQAGLLALVASLAAQLGDLAMSGLKRSVGAKDAGRLLPGHGGFLDRIDGLLFAAPVVYVAVRGVFGW